MPHRVATFFRNSTNSLENQVINLKKSTIRSRTKSPNRTNKSGGGLTNRDSRSAERVVSTYASSIDEDMEEPSPLAADQQPRSQRSSRPTSTSTSPAPPVVRRPKPVQDGHEKDHHHHRISFPSFHLGGSSKKEAHANPHATLSWKIESPPIIFHGDAESSTGALVSGQLFLDVRDEAGYEVDAFTATLHLHVTQKKPFAVHCGDCAHQHTLLKEWTFLGRHVAPATGAPVHLARGVHAFPFSVLLDGHLPATLDSPLASIAYEFKAEVLPANTTATGTTSPVTTPASATTAAATALVSAVHHHHHHHNNHNHHPQPIRLEKVFDVKRSLPAPEMPHHSVRVFPPTNVKASVHYQQVIHPIGNNTLTMRLDGIAKTNAATNTIEYWKLKKLTWRLEETLKTVAPACEKHGSGTSTPPASSENNNEQQQRNGVARTETRVIGEKTLFSGWKASYAGPTDSSVDLELEYALNKHARYSCDLHHAAAAAGGNNATTEVTHQLMLEMVVSQECAPVGKPGLLTQTGVGRILRMHFGTVLTERGGIGISWDNEAPPIYQDVPPSPPAYDLFLEEDEDDEEEGQRQEAACMEGLRPEVMESLDGSRPVRPVLVRAGAGSSSSGSGRNSGRGSAEHHRW